MLSGWNILKIVLFGKFCPNFDAWQHNWKAMSSKGLVAELTSPHVQSTWGFRGKRVRAAGLATRCNYFSKKKKKGKKKEKKKKKG